MPMLAESIKNILSGLAIDFIDGEARERTVYLYDKDVQADGLPYALPVNRVIKVTFEYADAPKSTIEIGE